MTRRDGGPSRFGEFLSGVGFVFRGFGVWRTAPGLMLLGLVPALIVAAVFVVGFVALGLNLQAITSAVTPFADGWDERYRTLIQAVVGLAFLAVAALFIALTFTTVTLIVGQPFYELIWRHVESSFGPVPDAGLQGFWRQLGRGIGDALRMLAPTVFVGVALLALGFVPVVGTIVAAVLGAFVGGWYLAVELTGLSFDARGNTLRERRRALRTRRPLVQGFGVATYLLFLVPLGAIVVMPAAVAGAALLSRQVLGEADALARR